jgi:Sec-independent protein translocase protein TatA
MSGFMIGGCVVLVVIAAVLLGAKPLRNWMWRRELERARGEFRRQREMLEAKFFDLASQSGKPRDLRWLDCEWLEAVSFARDRQTGLLTAFVAVNIRFEAVEGGDMEGVAAVSNIRDAAAVFHYQAGRWGTGGRALFNMNPADALVRLNTQFEPLGK